MVKRERSKASDEASSVILWFTFYLSPFTALEIDVFSILPAEEWQWANGL
jgi:hypothetical protein